MTVTVLVSSIFFCLFFLRASNLSFLRVLRAVSLGLVVAVAVVVSSVVVIAASPKTTQSSFVLPINVALVSFNVDAFLFAFLNWFLIDFNFIAIDLASIQEQGCIIVDMVGPNGVSLDVHYV